MYTYSQLVLVEVSITVMHFTYWNHCRSWAS